MYRNTTVGHDPPDEDGSYSGYYRGYKPSPVHSKGGTSKNRAPPAVPQQNFCGGCGNKLLIDSEFCVYCGKRCFKNMDSASVNSWEQDFPHMAAVPTSQTYGPGISDLGPHCSYMPEVRSNDGHPQAHGTLKGGKTRHSTPKIVEVRQ